MQYCPKCGASLPANAKFCSSCGADLSNPMNDPNPMEYTEYAKMNTELREKVFPWQVSLIGIIIGFLFLGIVPGIVSLLGNSQARNGQDVKGYVMAYNVFLAISILIWFVMIMFAIIAFNHVGNF